MQNYKNLPAAFSVSSSFLSTAPASRYAEYAHGDDSVVARAIDFTADAAKD